MLCNKCEKESPPAAKFCNFCGGSFIAEALPCKAFRAVPVRDAASTLGSPTGQEKACPFCAETIKAAAIICKHCDRDLPSDGALSEVRKQTKKPRRVPRILQTEGQVQTELQPDNQAHLELDDRSLSIYNTERIRQRKSIGIAYLWYFFFGAIGAHKFYMGRPIAAIIYILLSLTGWFTVGFIIGFLPLSLLAVLLFADLFLIPSQLRMEENRISRELYSALSH